MQPRTRALALTLHGEVRAYPFACPLPAGLSLRSSGWPLDFSPAELDMTLEAGFTGAANVGLADQVLCWRADSVVGGQSYDSYFLLRAGSSYRQWVAQGDARLLNQNGVRFIRTHRALFIRSRAGLPSWVQPQPWTP